MKKLYYLITLIILSSCKAYHSDYPIESATNAINCDEILGEWFLCKKIDSTFVIPSIITISRFDNNQYLLSNKIYSDEERIDEVKNYKLFKSSVNKDEYINLQELNSKSNNQYTFWKYNLFNNDSVHINYLTDSLDIKFPSSLEFKNYIINNKSLFDSLFKPTDFTYVRKQILDWDFVNPDSLNTIKSFSILIDEFTIDEFKSIPNEDLKSLKQNHLDLDTAKNNLKDFYYSPNSRWLPKGNTLNGVIVTDIGIHKILINYPGQSIYDLTTGKIYYPKNEMTTFSIKKRG